MFRALAIFIFDDIDYICGLGDLLDTTTVRQNDIVGGAHLTLTVWGLWISLVQAVAANDIEEVGTYSAYVL